MRYLCLALIALLVAGCGGPPAQATLPGQVRVHEEGPEAEAAAVPIAYVMIIDGAPLKDVPTGVVPMHIIRTLHLLTLAQLIGQNEDAALVRLWDGTEGWVSKDFVPVLRSR
jgi:hypothetical protein